MFAMVEECDVVMSWRFSGDGGWLLFVVTFYFCFLVLLEYVYVMERVAG